MDPPEMIIDDRWEKAFQNGPTYKVDIPIEDEKKIVVSLSRYRVAFESDSQFDDETESKIISFLMLLKYGRIISDIKTKNFSESVEEFKDYWKLKVDNNEI